MKTIYRSLVLGISMTVFVGVAATTSYAQDVCAEPAKAALDTEFRANYDKDIAKRETAVKAGKQFMEKYGACADVKDFVEYLKTAVPELEAGIAAEKKAEGEKIIKQQRSAVLSRFDAAAKAKNVSEVFTSGKEILNNESNFADVALDVNIALATAGFAQSLANPPVDTYNDDTINYAKSAIQKIESGKTSKGLGVWSYNLKDPKYTDAKSYALGALNYIVGYVTYYRQGKDNPEKRKEALSYLYKSTQYNSFTKAEPLVYQSIGAWYLDEALKIDKQRTEAIKVAGGTDTPETLAMFALSKGYADRAIDAYARTYKVAKDDKTQKKEYVDGLYTKLKDLYQFRFENTTGIDAYVASVQSKPLPDPTTAVTPVKEEAPATTTPGGAASTTETKPAAATTKPVSDTTTTKPATDVNATAATKTKPAAKKPAPKKKGTR
jgi:hypothetical protein